MDPSLLQSRILRAGEQVCGAVGSDPLWQVQPSDDCTFGKQDFDIDIETTVGDRESSKRWTGWPHVLLLCWCPFR